MQPKTNFDPVLLLACVVVVLLALSHWCLLIVLFVLFCMNMHWKSRQADISYHVRSTFILSIIGCIPAFLTNSMVFGLIGCMVFCIGTSTAAYYIARGPEIEEEREKVKETKELEDNPCTPVYQTECEIWVNGRWIPVDEMEGDQQKYLG